MVTAKTTEILAIIISFGGPEPLDRWTKRMVTLLVERAAAQNVHVQILQ
jgi:hypothetical protein